MVKLIENNPIYYGTIADHPKFIWDYHLKLKSDYNVYIPVRGRQNFLLPCVRHLLNSAKKAEVAISITVIENDIKPFYKKICSGLNINYLFIPIDVSYSSGLFAKSLCYNMGYIMSDTAYWNIFHDLDMIVDENFFINLKVHLDRKPNWLQPYQLRRVMRLSPYATDIITRNPDKIFSMDIFPDTKASNPGSPGGSIVVRNSDFMKIGGYDPEFFYGYGPEDSFFWSKLEVLFSNPEEPIKDLMRGGASYADDPPIDIYHLDHPHQEGNNPYLSPMLKIQEQFFNSSSADRLSLLEKKRRLIGKAMSDIWDH